MMRWAVRGKVAVGDHSDAYGVLRSPKRSHIKSVLTVNYTKLPIGKNIPHLRLAIEDDPNFSVSAFDCAIAFCYAAPKPILINCDAGVSRSSTFAAAYIWWDSWRTGKEGLSLNEALEMTRSPIAYPSPGVFERLVEWAEQFGATRTELLDQPAFDDFMQRRIAPSKDLEPRKEIGLFSKVMERKLRKHDKDFGSSWRDAPQTYLVRRLREEIDEAVREDGPEEWADVANCAMFLAFRQRYDVFRCRECGAGWSVKLGWDGSPCHACNSTDIVRTMKDGKEEPATETQPASWNPEEENGEE